MAVTLATLLTPRTRAQWRDLLLLELRDAGFALALAPSGDSRRNAVEFTAAALAKADEMVSKIAAGAFLETVVGDWLTLRARSGFDTERKAAGMTVGTVRLTCASTAGPYTVGVGGVWVGRAASGSQPARRFQNLTGGTLPQGGYIDVQVSAEAPGSAYNLGNGQITTLFTGLSGVSVSNPGFGVNNTWNTWITTQGTDEEGTDPLRARCRSRWGTIGRLANDSAYAYLATTASAEITRVRVYRGAGDGTVEVVVAGATGAVSESARAAADAAITAQRPSTDAHTVTRASVLSVVPTGTVYCRSASLAAAQAAADAARLAYLAAADIGAAVDLGAIYVCLRQPGVTDVDLVTPTGDTALSGYQVPGLDFSSLVWVAV